MRILIKKLFAPIMAISLAIGVGVSFALQSSFLEARAATASITSFTTVDGSIDANISYNSYKRGGTTAPAVNTNMIRLYQNASGSLGGYITITAAAGYKISAFTTTSGMATSLDYSVENATSWSGTKTSVAVDAAYSQSGLNAANVSIGCFGNSSNTRYYVKTLSITYDVSTDPSISVNSVPLNINVSDTGTMTATTANAGGATVTLSSNDDCLLINETTGAYSAESIGTAIVTASMTVESVLYTATGAVNISGSATIAEVITISGTLASGASTAYKVTVGGTISATATSTVTISDGVNSLLIYGTYSPNNAATKGWIVSGTISFTGNIQNYGGTPEIISPAVVSYTDDAISYATSSNVTLDPECAASSVTPETWAALASAYAALNSNAQARLTAATSSDANSAEIADFIARYIIIVNQYGYSNFMGHALATQPGRVQAASSNIYVVVIVAMSSIAILGIALFLKKKKEIK